MAARVSISIQSRNTATAEVDSYNIGYINPALLTENDRGAQKIDTCARALNSLSENTYVDTLLVTTESITEILNE